jgi:hypothetical protein
MKKLLLIAVIFWSTTVFAQSFQRFEIYFDSGSSTLTARAKTTLDSVRVNMITREYSDFFVKGYSDSTGAYQKNVELEKKREQASIDYIKSARPSQQIIAGTMYGREPDASLPDSLMRRVSLLFGMRCGHYPCNGKQNFKGLHGTIVTGYWKDSGHEHSVRVSDALASETMLEERFFAVDSLGKVLPVGHITEISGSMGDCMNFFDV